MSQGNIESNNIPNSCMQSYATILITQKIQHETRRPWISFKCSFSFRILFDF